MIPKFAFQMMRIRSSARERSFPGARHAAVKTWSLRYRFETFQTGRHRCISACHVTAGVLDTRCQTLEFPMSTSPSLAPQDLDPASRAPRRVRHEPRRRELEVKGVEKMSAHMLRVTLGRRSRGFHQPRFRRSREAVLPTRTGRRGRRTADGFARLHAPPLRPRRQYARDRVRAARRRPGKPLGQAGPAGTVAAHRRAARLLHHTD